MTTSTADNKLIETSYTREYQGNHVPRDYVFLTYDDYDAYDKPWLVSPAPLPMHGKVLLKQMAESVGQACVTDGAATPKYCLKDFYNSYNALDVLFTALDTTPFGDAQVKTVENVLETRICTTCNEKLFDYMYMGWADTSDDDKYMKVYMEMACSKAVGDDGADYWCLPVEKDMEDDAMPEMDPEASGYNEEAVEAYFYDQGDLWCGDLCVKTINSKYKEMYMVDLYANQSYMCGGKSCSAAEIQQYTNLISKEEAVEATYCHVVSHARMHAQGCWAHCHRGQR